MTAIFFVLYVGFFLIALSMPRHQQQLFPPMAQLDHFGVPLKWALRFLGWGTLVIAMAMSIRLEGLGIGLTLWTGLLTLASLTVALLALYVPKLAKLLFPCALAWLLFVAFLN